MKVRSSHIKVSLLRDKLSNEGETDGSNWIFNSRELAITIAAANIYWTHIMLHDISSLHNNPIRLL